MEYGYPDRITLCEDGRYRWSYVLNREQGRYYYRMMIKICSIVGGVITAAMLVMCSFLSSPGPAVWWSILAVPAGLIGLPALLGWFLMNGGETWQYELDREYIRHKHAAKGGDALIWFDRIRDLRIEGDVFIIKEGITTHRVHVPREDIPFLKQYIEKRRSSLPGR